MVASEGQASGGLLVTLIAVIAATKLLGEIAQRLRQPAVLGELVAGVLLGGSALGVLDPGDPVVAALAEIGVLVLLFAIGLETDLRALAKVGSAATTVALVGVILPLAMGYGAVTALGVPTVPALVCGAALTATSIGISARVLADLGRLHSPEGQVVLGAAVLDDVVGLIILSVVSVVVGGGTVTIGAVGRTTAVAVGFIAVAIALGTVAVPPVFRLLERVQVAGALGLFALAFAFGLAVLAHAAGSATIVGAFAAGLVLHPTPQRREIEHATTTIGHFFVPFFFASVGAAVELRALADLRALEVGALLFLVGVAGKVAAGFAPVWFRGHKLMIGLAMIPRGEVGLIFARTGLATGAIDARLFGAIMLMVLGTTFITPPLLSRLGERRGADRPVSDLPGEGGVDDLVAGASRRPDQATPAAPAAPASRTEDDTAPRAGP